MNKAGWKWPAWSVGSARRTVSRRPETVIVWAGHGTGNWVLPTSITVAGSTCQTAVADARRVWTTERGATVSELDMHADDSVHEPEDPEDKDIEAPEADSAEQSAVVGGPSDEALPSASFEVNEADAAEQSRVVELDEDDYR
jgi:hypothetical protein